MTLASQEAFSTALQAALLATSYHIAASNVWRDVVPPGQTPPWIVYSFNNNLNGPYGDLYNGDYQEDEEYLVDVVATTRYIAEDIAHQLGQALHNTQPPPSYILRRMRRAPRPAATPDQQLFTVSYYYRLKQLVLAGT